MTGTRTALDRWGDYDRSSPFAVRRVLAAAPIQDVTLVDGHRAFLVVGYDEARAALNHPDLSKDMLAALARDGAVAAEGLPGTAFARHMLSVDPPDHTRLRTLAPGVPPGTAGRPRAAHPTPWTTCSTSWRRPPARSTSWPGSRCPCRSR